MNTGNTKRASRRRRVLARSVKRRQQSKVRQRARWLGKILSGKMEQLPRRCCDAVGVPNSLMPKGREQGTVASAHVQIANARGRAYARAALNRGA